MCPPVEVVEDVGAVLWKLHVVDKALNNGVEDDATAWIKKILSKHACEFD